MKMTNTSEISPRNQFTETEIQNWIVAYMSELLEVEAKEIDITIPFNEYGLDSVAALSIVGDLEEWLDLKLKHTLLYKYPTIEVLVKHLVTKTRRLIK